MSENYQNHQHPVANAALRVGLAIAALNGGATSITEQLSAAPASATALGESPTVTPYAVGNEIGNQTSEFPLPAVAQTFANENTVYLQGIGCSGTLIHKNGNLTAPPVGVAFAKHCIGVNEPLTTVNGQTYDFVQPPIAETGTSQTNMTPIGQLTEVIVGNGLNSDHALGVLVGATEQEVVNSYRAERLSDDEINKLVPEKSMVYMRGWPINQEENTPDSLTAQQFAMPYIGQTTTTMTNGETIDVVVTAIPKRESKIDDSVCSFGASGSSGYVIEDGKPKIIGTLSGFWGFSNLYGGTTFPDYDPKGYLAEMRLNFPGVDWSKYAAACGFNFKAPKSTDVINLVPNSQAIPGEGTAVYESVYQAGLQFSNPNLNRTIVRGTAVVTYQGKGGGPGINNALVIDNPLISVGQNGDLMLGYYNNTGMVSAIDASDEGTVVDFYPLSSSKSVDTEVSSGALIYPPTDVNGIIQNAFIKDRNGLEFGNATTQEQAYQFSNETPWTVSVNNGQFIFNEGPSPTSTTTSPSTTPSAPAGTTTTLPYIK